MFRRYRRVKKQKGEKEELTKAALDRIEK